MNFWSVAGYKQSDFGGDLDNDADPGILKYVLLRW